MDDDDDALLCPDLETLELVSKETSDSDSDSSSHRPDRQTQDPWPWMDPQLLRCVRVRHDWGKPPRKLCLVRDLYARDERNLQEENEKQLLEYVEVVEVGYVLSS